MCVCVFMRVCVCMCGCFWSVCLLVCLPAGLSACRSVCLPVCLPVCPTVFLFVCPSMSLYHNINTVISFFVFVTDLDNPRRCAPRKTIAAFIYELSRSATIASSFQLNDDGRNFLIRLGNGRGEFQTIRNDLHKMEELKRHSPITYQVLNSAKIS